MTKNRNWFTENTRLAWIAGGLFIGLAAGIFWFPSAGEDPGLTEVQAEPVIEAEAPAQDQEMQYTYAAPEFSLLDEDGTNVDLSSFQGQPVLINFWASWCPPCKQEMLTFEDRYQQYRDQGFVILAINTDDSAAVIQDFREQYGISFHLLQDTEKKVIQLYAVSALPTSYFIDGEGNIVNRHVGLLTGEILDQYLMQLGVQP